MPRKLTDVSLNAGSVILKLGSFRSNSPSKGQTGSQQRLEHLTKASKEVEEMRAHMKQLRTASRFVLKPEGLKRQAWDCIVLVAMLYTAVWVPFEISTIPFARGESEWLVVTVFDRLFDLIFLLDIVMNCCTAYYDRAAAEWVRSHTRIVIRYARFWLWIDLLSILSSIPDMMGDTVVELQAFRVLRLLKLLRVLRASRIWERWESRIGMSYAALSLLRLVSGLVFLCHWLACVWMLVGRLEHDGDRPNWIDHHLLSREGRDGEIWKDNEVSWFIVSWHWSAMTITAIGYGDITPVSQLEYGISVLSQLLGAVLWAAAVSQLAGIYANLDPHETAWKQSMDALNYFRRDRNCDKQLSRRVREFLIASKQTQRRQRESGILLLMSPALQGEVAQQSHKSLLNGIYYFRGATADFVLQISLAIQTRCFAPREMVWHPHLHVVYTGLAAVRGVIKMRSQVWNEDFIVLNMGLRRGDPACALTFLEVFQLERDLLFDLLDNPTFANERCRVKRAALFLAIRRWLVVNHRALKSTRQSPSPSPVAASAAQGVLGEAAAPSPGGRPPQLSVPDDLRELSGGERSAPDRSSRGGDSEDGSLDRVACGKPAASTHARGVFSRHRTSSRELAGASLDRGGSKRGVITFGHTRSMSATSLPPVTSLEGYWSDTLSDKRHPGHLDEHSCHSARSLSSSYSPKSGRARPPQWSALDGSVGLNSRTAPSRMSPSPSGGMGQGRHEARQEARLMQLSATVADLARQQARMLSMLEAVTSSSRGGRNSPPATEASPPGDAIVRAEVRAMLNVSPRVHSC
jgi:hypothetical protein